jgi:LPXTG-motif cell wall-anchored protein
MLALVAPAGIVAADETQQVPLHNTNAPTEGGSNCPNAVDDFWHFVAVPGSTDFAFESITIVAGNPPTAYTFSGSDIIVNNNSNNVFVKVPAGVDPYSIQLAGSFAVISPATPEAQFNLSHYCDGSTTSTTTTTTTSSTSTTSSTTSTTTTSMPTTTTTDAGTTTTTTDAGTTTTTQAGNPTTTTEAGATTSSSVAQLPPASTTSTTPLTDPTTTSSSVAQMPPLGPTTTLLVTPPTGGNPVITPALPETGSETAAQVALAAAAVLGAGLAIVAASRRRGTVEG